MKLTYQENKKEFTFLESDDITLSEEDRLIGCYMAEDGCIFAAAKSHVLFIKAMAVSKIIHLHP